MSPQKRRVLVAFEDDAAGRDQKRQRKIAVSIDITATNADLAREIAATLDQPAVSLEISGGFELRDQDGVDTIAEGDIVTARSCAVPMGGAVSAPKTESRNDTPLTSPVVHAAPEEPARAQFRFVTAELARAHARSTPKEQSEATNGILAFDGEFVSGNTPLSNGRQLEFSGGRQGNPWSLMTTLSVITSTPMKEHAAVQLLRISRKTVFRAPCTVASQPTVQAVGINALTLTLNCRSVLRPLLRHAPYARRPLLRHAPYARRHWLPHAQNATARRVLVEMPWFIAPWSRTPDVATSTMRIALTLEGAVVFDEDEPHLIIAWDGERIDSVPVPFSMDGVSRDSISIVTVTSDAIVLMVENFLERRDFAHAGLSLRIHSRDPVAELVRFSQSTLVSVCPASSHPPQNYRRFPLFSSVIPRNKPVYPLGTFAIDLHTSHAPIVACGCTPIKRLFPPPGSSGGESSVLLYAVKRRTEVPDASSASDKREIASKQSMYLADAAWHPSVPQTPRGIAALLSSLYLLAHSVAQKNIAGEQKVLALAYAIFRFPPAVRTLAALFLNKVPRPEDKAALTEAIYQALAEFSSRGPYAITGRETRRFETVRILLAYMASAADVGSAALPQRPVDEISLVCALSQKRLANPVLLEAVVVERAVAQLHQPGGLLFRPGPSTDTSSIVEIGHNEILPRILAHSPGLRSESTLVLRVDDIGTPPASFLATLDAVGRDFLLAIRRANQTDLVTRGPLELKSADVVPPQIVLDQEGLLAVFTGRGCGTARDVNFFRPANGGDTEVDVNDISHALEKVIIARKLEDTWQVDSFGEVSAVSRPPDEAIVLCLDLSESMNERSAVSKSVAHRDEELPFNVEIESAKLVDKIITEMTRSQILEKAEAYLKSQHASCHNPWAAKLNLVDSDVPDDDSATDLLRHLAIVASRKALRLSFKEEDSDEDEDEDEDMYGDESQTSHGGYSDSLLQMVCFVGAMADDDMKSELAQVLTEMVRDANLGEIGSEPYSVPRALIDFKTGELLVDPVRPRNAPPHTFVNSTSKAWFESQRMWPAGPCVAQYDSATQLKKAVASWIAATDILPKIKNSSKGDAISVTLRHLSQEHTWILLPQTPVRTLYSLANRASQGAYASFVLRTCYSGVGLTDGLLISETALARGGAIEVVFSIPHRRRRYEINIEMRREGSLPYKFLMPQDSSILALLSYLEDDDMRGVSDYILWYGLQDSGDGLRRGQLAGLNTLLSRWGDSSPVPHTISFECELWRWFSPHAQRAREESKHLSRLHLLKTLFDVFLNRAGSFDTTVSLVLGLITFSNEASVKQELTPVFEKFREQLEAVDACGDTAVYDALDSARRLLTNFRPDLPNLRRRIVIVSDGEDTNSKISAHEVCRSLQKGRIIVDSVQVGSKSDRVLHAISVATGGYRFSPRTSLADALSIFASNHYIPTQSAHIKAVVADPHPNVDVYVNDRDISFLKIILEAPKDVDNCPYKGGTFLLSCDLPAGYPRDPPEIRFVTFILHPNVSKQGKVCIAELGRLWSSDITLKEIFSLIYGTLLTPDLENPLEIQASLKYYDDDGTYALAVADAVAKHASKTRAQWQEELDD
ncbi:hypothetical protein FB451DRAFT_1412223 [Mycena latifolia]|nr:hypothetical protein FB451DRAFT_1412223 [Mycena latifolia]